MIGQAEDGGPLMHDAALAWNSAVADYRISPNRVTAAALFDAAGEWALDVGPITDVMQAMLDESSVYRGGTPAHTAGVPAWLAVAGAVLVGGLFVMGTGRRRRR